MLVKQIQYKNIIIMQIKNTCATIFSRLKKQFNKSISELYYFNLRNNVVEKILGSFKSRECEFANKRDRDDK